MAHAQKPFESVEASVQSTAGSRGVCISLSNAGYTTNGCGVRVLATHSIHQFPLHFPSRTSPCATRFRTNSTTKLIKLQEVICHRDITVMIKLGIVVAVTKCRYGFWWKTILDSKSPFISLYGAIYPSLSNCVKTAKYRHEKHQRAIRSRRHVNLHALQNSTECFEMPYK
jgi:hypothetical protein